MSLESFRIQPLRLDHIDAHIPDRLIAHELDSAGRILRVQLTDGGDVRDTTGTSLSLAWKHQRGASGLEPFSVVDATTGVYEVTYPSAMMLDGVATCSIQVAEGSSVAATRNFHVRIQDAPIDGDATASTDTWTALQLILTEGQTAVTALEEQHTEHATAHDDQMQQQASDWQAQTTGQASAHDTQMQQQASEFSTAQSTRADEFTDALTDYQAQVDAAAASATEVYIGTGTPPENAVLWIDTTDGGKRVKSLVDGQWVEADAGTLGGVAPSGYASQELADRLGASTAHLPTGTDLNTVQQPGVYTLNGGWSYQNPAPIGWGFLYVTATNSGAWIRQVIANSNAKHERVYINGSWTVWRQQPYADYLPDGTNLNSQTSPGVYAMSGANTYVNSPAAETWGFLEVTANTTGAIIRQVVSRTHRTRYERWYTSGSWSTWEQVQKIV